MVENGTKPVPKVESHEEQMRRWRVTELNQAKDELTKFRDEAVGTRKRVGRLISKLLDVATDRMGSSVNTDDAWIAKTLEAIGPTLKNATVGTEALVEIADHLGRVLAEIRKAEGLDVEPAPAA